MNCKYCKDLWKKKGKYNETQKLQCRSCSKYQRSVYSQRCYTLESEQQVKLLNNEGVSISSIARILTIPRSSVQMLLLRASSRLQKPVYGEFNEVYEVDELYTHIGKKANPCYIIYAINRKTKQVIDFVCGARNKENISKVITALLYLSPRRIYTDKLNIFSALIPRYLHRTFQYRTNCIERKNLTLRTHLKRICRKTICYSKSIAMLEVCFRLYVWR